MQRQKNDGIMSVVFSAPTITTENGGKHYIVEKPINQDANYQSHDWKEYSYTLDYENYDNFADESETYEATIMFGTLAMAGSMNIDNVRLFAIDADGNAETVEVPAESGIRRKYKFTLGAPAIENVITTFKTDGGKKKINTQITIKDKPATKAEHEKLMETNSKHVWEIKRLLKKCDEAGISTDYENVNYQVMVLFEEYLDEYLDKGYFDNTYCCERKRDELYRDAKENLNAYLDGSKEPRGSVPTYVTSDTTFKGGSAYALTELDGKIEERPLTFMGYCLFARNAEDIYKIKELGGNTVQMEIGPTEIVSNVPTYVEGQPIQLSLDPAKLAALSERLETAQELGVAVTMLLTAHYFPSSYIDANNMRQSGESWMFLKYNVNADAAKAYMKAWLEAIVTIISEYDSVQNVLISNEPAGKWNTAAIIT